MTPKVLLDILHRTLRHQFIDFGYNFFQYLLVNHNSSCFCFATGQVRSDT